MKQLVIVESPAKARTISRFLGKDYEIKFSMGHVMDLPKSKLGVDVEHAFEPQLEIVEDKKQIIAELKTSAKRADLIILATDPDREGEAIAENIKNILSSNEKRKTKNEKFKRIVFHEITKEAIEEALRQPRSVDTSLVDAQTARRVLDRLVGYKISPILWQKVRRGLSAGRVQSVALRLIVEREREIEKFTKEPYFTIHALLKKSTDKHPVEFELIEINSTKIETQQTFTFYDGKYTVTKTSITDLKKADEILSDLETKQYEVADVAQKEIRRFPQPPYTTSTLQQDASRRFGYPGKRTMSLAQKLYEEGFITYHRTDSTTLSSAAVSSMRGYIEKTFGKEYVPPSARVYAAKQKLAQEAHEGIRHTHMQRDVAEVRGVLGNDCAKLYDLIWRRAVASQMADAIIESTNVIVDATSSVIARNEAKYRPVPGEVTKQSFKDEIAASVFGETRNDNVSYRLKTNGSVLKFDGFLKVNPQALQDTKLPQYTIGEELSRENLRKEEHETPPPPRYNDASLIATLEEKGIGRPSTYASIISVLTDRAYVERVERRFVPTPVGMAVNDFLVENFSAIDDIPFTVQLESHLDAVAAGEKAWEEMMQDFYTPFAESLEKVKDAPRVKIEAEETGEKCPECSVGDLVIRVGKFGKFLSCSRFPLCKFTKPYVEQTNLTCPKCVAAVRQGGNIIIKKTRTGRKFYGCSNYPNCDFAAWKLEDIKGYKPQKTPEEQQAEVKSV
ncbi:MAG: type I DNA topoisomerase [Candidatus Levybacteria bacterium]|nr:type I DNA topoisomerase [Candidatus Levybacteria bacterium]